MYSCNFTTLTFTNRLDKDEWTQSRKVPASRNHHSHWLSTWESHSSVRHLPSRKQDGKPVMTCFTETSCVFTLYTFSSSSFSWSLQAMATLQGTQRSTTALASRSLASGFSSRLPVFHTFTEFSKQATGTLNWTTFSWIVTSLPR